MLIAFIAIIGLIIITALNYIKMRELGKIAPGPSPLPFIGNAHQIGSSIDYLKIFGYFLKIYGSKFRIFIGSQLLIGFTDPEDVEAVLSNNKLIEKAHEYKLMEPWLGKGLLTGPGEKWKKHRKAIAPTFHFKILQHFVEIFDLQTTILVDKLKQFVSKGSFDIHKPITLCALDVICEAGMGIKIQAQKYSDSEYVLAVQDVCRIIYRRMENPIKQVEFLFFFTSDYWLQRKSLKILHSVTDKMINERRKMIMENKESYKNMFENNNTESDSIGDKKKLAFLDMLLLSTIDGKPLSDVDIRDEVDTFLFGGYDTTGTATSHILYFLSRNPEAQQKVYEEQRDIFADDLDRNITYNDLQDMKYLELVIKESLRLLPSVPLIGRRVLEDTEINGLKLPANSSVVILVYHLHRNERIFPDPEKFIPERFLPDECIKRNPFSAIPFSAGPRNCIGQKFAMLEMKATVSKILRKYELLSSGEELVLSADLTLKPIGGAKIKIVERIN